jgi:aldehyde:ferredoxin oxidoreductase
VTHECWNKKILWADLSTLTTRTEHLESEIYEKFIGGKGLGAYLLYRSVDNNTDPLGPDNVLFLLSGPLQGLPGPNVGRWSVVTKSPLTGIFLDTHCGGPTGRDIKKAGYDALCIVGRANRPTTIVIDDGMVDFEDATALWGKGIYESTEALRRHHNPNFSVYVIGPAGERQVKFAMASCEIAHQTGRGGVGAVMGSKNLKAVVVRGSSTIEAHDAKEIRAVNREFNESWRNLDIDFKKYGTRHLVELANASGQFPTYNYRSGHFKEHTKIGHETLEHEYKSDNNYSCPHCVMRCTHAFTTQDPRNLAVKVESTIEYETLGLLGGNLGISNPNEVLMLNYLCDDLGLDTISTGGVIGFTIEALERGLLSEDRIGLKVTFGDFKHICKLVQMIAWRDGIGDLLAEGVRHVAGATGKGSEEFAIHVKGLEIPAWDPRGRLGQGLLYATGDIGGSHLRGWPPTSDPPDSSVVPFVEALLPGRIEKIVKDSLIICHFTNRVPITLEQMTRMLVGASGVDYSLDDVRNFAFRVESLIRLFNIREGVTRKDDTLPHRFMEPEPDGPRQGMTAFVDESDLDRGLERYYELLGWDENGIPTAGTLRKLGLDDLPKEINES